MEAADLVVSQPVEHQGEELAGSRHPGDVAAPAVGDPLEAVTNRSTTVVAGHRLNRRPANQRRSLFGDPTPVGLGVRLTQPGGKPCPRTQPPRVAEPGYLTDLGNEHGGVDSTHPVELLDHAIAGIIA